MSSLAASTKPVYTSSHEEGEVTRVDLDNVSTSSNAPDMVDPDMENGLESVSCKLAKTFYERYGASLHGITKRGALSQFYIDTYETWCPTDLNGQPRHFKQVLYALVNDGKVVRVVGGGRFLRWTAFRSRRAPRDSGSRDGGSRPRRNSRDRRSGDSGEWQDRRNGGARSHRGPRQQRHGGQRSHYGKPAQVEVSDDLVSAIVAKLAEQNTTD